MKLYLKYIIILFFLLPHSSILFGQDISDSDSDESEFHAHETSTDQHEHEHLDVPVFELYRTRVDPGNVQRQ